MSAADEQFRRRLESRARKSVQYGRIPEHQWAQRPLANCGLDVRGNARFRDQTGEVIIGIDDIIGGGMTTGPA